MLRFLDAFKSDTKLLHMSEEPLDLRGARPVPGILTKKIEDLEIFVQQGPAISLSALVNSLTLRFNNSVFFNCGFV
jgi:hypothetical protein